MRRSFKTTKNTLRQVRHSRVRKALGGTAERPRLSVFRSLKHISVQLIDDIKGVTICCVNSREINSKEKSGKGKIDKSFAVGKLLAEKAKIKKISQVVFDRGGYRFHGRVKAVAEGAREGGLIF